jgi:hypothetical protein
MQVSGGGTHIHHHGLLAGLGAGAVAVLAGLTLMLAAWRAVGHAVGQAATVIVWAVAAVVLAAAAYAMVFLFLRARHHVTHPETLVRQSVRAEVIPAQVEPATVPAVLPGKPVAALPPGWRVLPEDPDEAIAAIVRWRDRP